MTENCKSATDKKKNSKGSPTDKKTNSGLSMTDKSATDKIAWMLWHKSESIEEKKDRLCFPPSLHLSEVLQMHSRNEGSDFVT